MGGRFHAELRVENLFLLESSLGVGSQSPISVGLLSMTRRLLLAGHFEGSPYISLAPQPACHAGALVILRETRARTNYGGVTDTGW